MIHIAFVSSSIYGDRVKKLVETEFNYIKVTFITYELNYTDVTETIRQRQSEFDAILFSGNLSYYYCSSVMKQEVPWYLVQAYSSHLSAMLRKALQLGYDISSISINSMEMDRILSAYRELGLDTSDITVFHVNMSPEEYVDQKYIQKIIDFHMTNAMLHHVGCCFCNALIAYKKLESMHIPVVFLEMNFDSFRRAFHQVYLHITEKLNQQSQIVVTAAEIALPSENSVTALDTMAFIKSRLAMTEKVYRFATKLKGIVAEQAQNRFLIICTKANFSEATGDFNEFALFKEINSDPLNTTFLGIGLGESAIEARQHAYAALERARQKGSNTACLVASTGETVLFASYATQLTLSQPTEVQNSATDLVRNNASQHTLDEKIVLLASRSGLSVKRMYQLCKALQERPAQALTSSELAQIMDMSKRSTDRMIIKLEAAGIVKVIGQKNRDDLGRPSRLLSFSFELA